MKHATGGVNTHKGAIFSLGIYCAALGMGYDGEKSDACTALMRCGEMTRERMAQELECIDAQQARTFGEEIYQKSRIGGVRAEAASGFAAVREFALPRLRNALSAGLNLNDAGLCALVSLMAHTQDTNAVRRGGEEMAEKLREGAAALDAKIESHLKEGNLEKQMNSIRQALVRWDEAMSEKRISPGGCADLLALTLLAEFME